MENKQPIRYDYTELVKSMMGTKEALDENYDCMRLALVDWLNPILIDSPEYRESIKTTPLLMARLRILYQKYSELPENLRKKIETETELDSTSIEGLLL